MISSGPAPRESRSRKFVEKFPECRFAANGPQPHFESTVHYCRSLSQIFVKPKVATLGRIYVAPRHNKDEIAMQLCDERQHSPWQGRFPPAHLTHDKLNIVGINENFSYRNGLFGRDDDPRGVCVTSFEIPDGIWHRRLEFPAQGLNLIGQKLVQNPLLRPSPQLHQSVIQDPDLDVDRSFLVGSVMQSHVAARFTELNSLDKPMLNQQFILLEW